MLGGWGIDLYKSMGGATCCKMFCLAFLAVLLPALLCGGAAKLTTVDNGIIRVGVDSDRGGSITYLSASSSDSSVINTHDMGREVQLSFYSGPPQYEPSPGSQKCNTTWRQGDWPWNPIGAGDVDGHSGKVLHVSANSSAHSIQVRSQPLQWACDNVPCECTFDKTITLDGTAARVETTLTNFRSDHTAYPAHGQELPAVYSVGSLYQIVAYNGTKPFTNDSLTYFPITGKAHSILATEHWAALVNKDGWGLAVFQPGTIHITANFFGSPGDYGPLDNPTGYLGPNHLEILDWNIVYNYRFDLVLGNLKDLRTYAYQKCGEIEDCLSSVFASDRQHWVYNNAGDTGQPQGIWRVTLEQNDPQLVGPNCLWNTEQYSMLYINASYSSALQSSDAQVFWNPHGVGQVFDEAHSVHFNVEPDGKFHLLAVDLSKTTSYTGSAFGLRFDPVGSGNKGAYVDIASIVLK